MPHVPVVLYCCSACDLSYPNATPAAHPDDIPKQCENCNAELDWDLAFLNASAEGIVDRIIEEISGRSMGWDSIDAETQAEIKESFSRVVRGVA